MIIKGIRFFEEPKLEDIKAFLESHKKTQLVNSNCVFGERHVKHTLLEVKRAFEEKRNITNFEELEFLLRLVGKRQISKAIETCSVKQDAVFISWQAEPEIPFTDFLNDFKFEEVPLKKRTEEQILDAIEKTAIFYI